MHQNRTVVDFDVDYGKMNATESTNSIKAGTNFMNQRFLS